MPKVVYPSTKLARIQARVSPESEYRIQEFALRCGITVQQLILEALSDRLIQNDLEPLAETPQMMSQYEAQLKWRQGIHEDRKSYWQSRREQRRRAVEQR